jgi:2-hydroxy-3-keto-5-methylthiopentenyl-1-phosphate phosphatase
LSSNEEALNNLIAIEWEIISKLQKRLANEDSVTNIVKVSNSIAYHVNNLNKLLARKNTRTSDEGEDLAHVIAALPKKFISIISRRVKIWERKKFSKGA